jgi:hypothetical protein
MREINQPKAENERKISQKLKNERGKSAKRLKAKEINQPKS